MTRTKPQYLGDVVNSVKLTQNSKFAIKVNSSFILVSIEDKTIRLILSNLVENECELSANVLIGSMRTMDKRTQI